MAKEEQKQSTLGTPMPSNAAGPWRKFDADNQKTWPKENGLYLVWTLGSWRQDIWNCTARRAVSWDRWKITHYAEILPPESRGK